MCGDFTLFVVNVPESNDHPWSQTCALKPLISAVISWVTEPDVLRAPLLSWSSFHYLTAIEPFCPTWVHCLTSPSSQSHRSIFPNKRSLSTRGVAPRTHTFLTMLQLNQENVNEKYPKVQPKGTNNIQWVGEIAYLKTGAHFLPDLT